MLAALFLVVVAGTGCGKPSPSPPDDFPGCEGYWAPPSACLPLGSERPKGRPTEDNKDCPQWRMDAQWGDREHFLHLLYAVEAAVKQADSEVGPQTRSALESHGLGHVNWVNVYSYRGLAPSRIEPERFVGNREFADVDATSGICWPSGYSGYYIAEHSVVPSQRFQRYIRNFDVGAFNKAVSALTPEEQATTEQEKSHTKAEESALLVTDMLQDEHDLES